MPPADLNDAGGVGKESFCLLRTWSSLRLAQSSSLRPGPWMRRCSPGRRTRRFRPWIRMTAAGEEEPLPDLASLLGRDGFGANGIAVPEHPSGDWGIHASHSLATGKIVGGEAGGPR